MDFPLSHPLVSAHLIWWTASSSKSQFLRTAARNLSSTRQTWRVQRPWISRTVPSPSPTTLAPCRRAVRPIASPGRWAPTWKTSWWMMPSRRLASPTRCCRQCPQELLKRAVGGAVWVQKKRSMRVSELTLALPPLRKLLPLFFSRLQNLPEEVFLIIFL